MALPARRRRGDKLPAFISGVGALAMGSVTYEWMLKHVVGPEAPQPQPWPYTQPTWVFSSRTRAAIPGADIRFVRGDVRPVHDQMIAAAGGKNVWVVGGGELAGQFYDRGLLDEMFVQVGSVTHWSGKTATIPRTIVSPPLRLVSVKAVGTGFAGTALRGAEARLICPREDLHVLKFGIAGRPTNKR
jgi:dihydrofolate reductase